MGLPASIGTSRADLKKLCHDILSHFYDDLNYCLSVRKPKNKGLLRKKKDEDEMRMEKFVTDWKCLF